MVNREDCNNPIHTNTIEGWFKHLKQELIYGGGNRELLALYVANVTFKSVIHLGNPFPEMMKLIRDSTLRYPQMLSKEDITFKFLFNEEHFDVERYIKWKPVYNQEQEAREQCINNPGTVMLERLPINHPAIKRPLKRLSQSQRRRRYNVAKHLINKSSKFKKFCNLHYKQTLKKRK